MPKKLEQNEKEFAIVAECNHKIKPDPYRQGRKLLFILLLTHLRAVERLFVLRAQELVLQLKQKYSGVIYNRLLN